MSSRIYENGNLHLSAYTGPGGTRMLQLTLIGDQVAYIQADPLELADILTRMVGAIEEHYSGKPLEAEQEVGT